MTGLITEMKIALLTDTAIVPTRKNSNDAGLDLYADLLSNTPLGRVVILSESYGIISTGVTIEVPENCFAWITNKSRNNFLIGGGIVDEGYQGELLVKVFNPTTDDLVIRHGDAIAQLIVIPVMYPTVKKVEKSEIHIKESDRGVSGGILDQNTEIVTITFEEFITKFPNWYEVAHS